VLARAEGVFGEGGERLRHSAGPVRGRAVVVPQEDADGEPGWNLKACSAVAGSLALCNVYYPEEGDREWAVRLWHSLTHVAPPPPAAGG
jgi:hypothetical protein